ncbi:MAG: hypothetical protein HY243_09080 [Proteobacteria bacterium]|nr:hypothetical protein [Pseudomonadota bacterium]
MIPERPEAGMVFRYSFLWSGEAAKGQIEGVKDRPAVVIVLLAEGDEVVVAPFTTRPPAGDDVVVEVPQRVRTHLGLGDDRSWISLGTLNRFVWPGPDLRPVPGRKPANALYGYIPQKLLDAVKALAMAELSKRIPGLIVRRSND